MNDYPSPPRSPLACVQPATMDVDEVKQRGWTGQNILVVSAEDQRLSEEEQELIKQLGDKLYGPTPNRQEVRHG